jgi:hypothetical protein
MGSMLMRRAKRKRFPGFVLSSFWLFETIQNCRSTAIVVQYCVYFGTTSCGRKVLNECLTDQYVLAYVEVEFCEAR